MCGICGVLDFSGRPVDGATVRRMAEALHHRGPEATRVFLSPTPGAAATRGAAVGLGHTRLKIIDLSDAANHPLSNEDGTVWVMLNGEIYNFLELREELKAAGHQFRTEGDTEVIVHLYEEMGERCVERLDGMFALAVWDERRRRLFLARDRTGKKPLFYHRSPSFFAFGSEIKSLLAHGGIAGDVSLRALPQLFLYGYVPNPGTVYEGIAVASAPGRPASDNGRLCHGDGGHEGGERRWRALMLTILLVLRLPLPPPGQQDVSGMRHPRR